MTRRRGGHGLVLTVALLALVASAGCGPTDPAERVEALRARYTATLNGFLVRQEPAPEPAPPDAAETAVGAAAETVAAPEAGVEAGIESGVEEDGEGLVAPVPLTSDVVLDIVVQHDSREKLPGITVEVELADGARREKEHHRVWIDTSRIERGPGAQVSYVLEDVPYLEGDAFFVEVRSPVPPAERGLYREFSAPAAGGGGR